MNAAVVPQRVQATVDFQRGALAEVALEHFTVVTHLLDDLHDPVFLHFQVFAVFAVGTEQTRDVRVLGGLGFSFNVFEVIPASSALSMA